MGCRTEDNSDPQPLWGVSCALDAAPHVPPRVGTHLILTTAWEAETYFPHVTDEETEAEGSMAALWHTVGQVEQLRFRPRQPGPQVPALLHDLPGGHFTVGPLQCQVAYFSVSVGVEVRGTSGKLVPLTDCLSGGDPGRCLSLSPWVSTELSA